MSDYDDEVSGYDRETDPAPSVAAGRGDWMQLNSGERFWPLDPRPEDLDLESIAHALGMVCRYGGHVDRFYSVAEHSVLLSDWFKGQGDLIGAARALFHDSAEAIVGDMVRPLKRSMPAFVQAEAAVLRAIEHRFGIPGLLTSTTGLTDITMADTRILLDERAALMANTSYPWGVDGTAAGSPLWTPLGVPIWGWEPHRARDEFLARVYLLGIEAQ
jgi:hypothetical protein